MNKNAEKWVNALESGKYLQTTGYLEKEIGTEKFNCCLGVACRIYAEEHSDWYIEENQFGESFTSFNGNAAYLPEEVEEWLGLGEYRTNNFNPDIITQNELMGMNDAGKNFLEIAAVIRSMPEGLFTSDDE